MLPPGRSAQRREFGQQARLQGQGEIMRYVEENLTEGERIIHTTRRHWIVLVGPAFVPGLLALSGMGFAFIKDLRVGARLMSSLTRIFFSSCWASRPGS